MDLGWMQAPLALLQWMPGSSEIEKRVLSMNAHEFSFLCQGRDVLRRLSSRRTFSVGRGATAALEPVYPLLFVVGQDAKGFRRAEGSAKRAALVEALDPEQAPRRLFAFGAWKHRSLVAGDVLCSAARFLFETRYCHAKQARARHACIEGCGERALQCFGNPGHSFMVAFPVCVQVFDRVGCADGRKGRAVLATRTYCQQEDNGDVGFLPEWGAPRICFDFAVPRRAQMRERQANLGHGGAARRRSTAPWCSRRRGERRRRRR
jgi:hypothetical protein